MRQRGMALTTERSYVRQFRDFMKRRKLKEASSMCAAEFKAYLDYLAMDANKRTLTFSCLTWSMRWVPKTRDEGNGN